MFHVFDTVSVDTVWYCSYYYLEYLLVELLVMMFAVCSVPGAIMVVSGLALNYCFVCLWMN